MTDKPKLGCPPAITVDEAQPGTKQAAGIVFVAPDGDVLVLRRSSAEANYSGHWALPGGGVDAGETPQQGALREAREEIGFAPEKVPTLKLMARDQTPTGMTFSTFALPVETKFVPTLNDEHSGWAWASLDSLPGPLHPSVAKTLGQHIGVTADMSAEDWAGLRDGFLKWIGEEASEAEHAHDAALIAMDRNLYDARGKRIMGADRLALDRSASVRSYDADGHLHVARTPISKANVCEYYGHEIPGAEELGLDPGKKYRLLRDPAELKKAAVSSNGKPLMIKHVPTNADDHQGDLVVGSVGTDADYQHPYLFNSLAVWDRKGIDGIEDKTQTELSSAYRYRADMTPGTYEGAAYDGVMRDIDFNHVALVPEGRAGADVVVGDGKPHGEIKMSQKTVLTRKGTFLAGAVAVYLMPKLAQDSKFDPAAAFAGVTAKNFKAQKPKIVEYIKNKVTLAADADLEDLTTLLDALDKTAIAEGADIDPSSGLPMTAPAKKPAEDEEDDADKEAAAKARAEKLEAYKKAQGMDEEACKAFDELMSDLDGSSAATVEAAAADDAEEDEPKKVEPKMVTKEAMDAAIATARTETQAETLRTANAISEAKEVAFKWVGRLAMDATAPADVYKAALDHLQIDTKDIHPSAFRKILEAQPVPGAAAQEMALDATPDVSGFQKRFGALTDRIAITG